MSIKAFLSDQSGAVTTDWFVLTAAITALASGLAAAVGGGTAAVAGQVQTTAVAEPGVPASARGKTWATMESGVEPDWMMTWQLVEN